MKIRLSVGMSIWPNVQLLELRLGICLGNAEASLVYIYIVASASLNESLS